MTDGESETHLYTQRPVVVISIMYLIIITLIMLLFHYYITYNYNRPNFKSRLNYYLFKIKNYNDSISSAESYKFLLLVETQPCQRFRL